MLRLTLTDGDGCVVDVWTLGFPNQSNLDAGVFANLLDEVARPTSELIAEELNRVDWEKES